MKKGRCGEGWGGEMRGKEKKNSVDSEKGERGGEG